MQMKNSTRSGFVIYVVLGSIFVVALLVGSVIGYAMTSLRSSAGFVAGSECRLAVQSVLEETKIGMNAQFRAYFDDNPSIVNALDWFDGYSQTSIGSSGYGYDLPQQAERDGFVISVQIEEIVKNPVPETAPYARVRLRAQASGASVIGTPMTKTIEETVDLGLRRAGVFDSAYFVDHFGELTDQSVVNGSGGTNGDFLVDPESLVNGYVHAQGSVGGSETVDSWDLEEYWQRASDAARPTNPPGTDDTVDYPMGYDPEESPLAPYQAPIEMPFIGDLNPQRELAVAVGGKLVQGGSTIVNAVFNGTGPSEVPGAADERSLILDGKNGILYLDGPVVIDRDVVIQGTLQVSGQGTIYAGRNIHILGDVLYVNGPAWPKPDENPEATLAANTDADLLGLVAKGNIVLDAFWKATPWQSDVSGAIQDNIDTSVYYPCDPSDAPLGYCSDVGPYTFNGDYMAEDGLEKVTGLKKQRQIIDGRQVFVTTATEGPSRFYESLVYEGMLSASTLTQIDAVLYSNHAIMGKAGNIDIDGSMICRDDLVTPLNWVTFEWDVRLGSRSLDGLNLPIFFPAVVADPKVVGWREVVL